MSRPQQYRDVPLPDEWDQWPPDAQVNYLCTAMDRDQLLSLVREEAGIPDDEVGEQSIHKAGLAQLVVTLQDGDVDG